MTHYVQFLTLDLNENVSNFLGSDGIFILDGRNKLDTMIEDSYTRMYKINGIHPQIVGFQIVKGARFSDNNQIIYTVIQS